MFGAEILETREKIRPRMKNMYVDVMYILVKFRRYTLVQCHFERNSRTLKGTIGIISRISGNQENMTIAINHIY